MPQAYWQCLIFNGKGHLDPPYRWILFGCSSRASSASVGV
jgi:hypothetical protein